MEIIHHKREVSLYYVWSEEHGSWWGPDRSGYTRSIKKAGTYTYEEALDICGNPHGINTKNDFDECLMKAEYTIN